MGFYEGVCKRSKLTNSEERKRRTLWELNYKVNQIREEFWYKSHLVKISIVNYQWHLCLYKKECVTQNEDHWLASHPEKEVRGAVFIFVSPRLFCHLRALVIWLFYLSSTCDKFISTAKIHLVIGLPTDVSTSGQAWGRKKRLEILYIFFFLVLGGIISY